MDINSLAVIFLNQLSGFGPRTIIELISNLNNLNKMWSLNKQQLINLGLTEKKIRIFNDQKEKFKPQKIAAELKKKNINYLTFYNQKYPARLK
ncbi:MAG: DNA processing protein, partial [Halanaerobium sp.]